MSKNDETASSCDIDLLPYALVAILVPQMPSFISQTFAVNSLNVRRRS